MQTMQRPENRRISSLELSRLLKGVGGTGKTAAAARLAEIYSNRLYSLAYRILGDGPSAEDVVQDVYVSLMEGKASFSGRGAWRVSSDSAFAKRPECRRVTTAIVTLKPLPRHEVQAIERYLRGQMDEETTVKKRLT